MITQRFSPTKVDKAKTIKGPKAAIRNINHANKVVGVLKIPNLDGC